MSLNHSSIERLKSVFSQLKSCFARTLLFCVPDFVVDVLVIVSYKTSLKIMGILKFGYRVPWTNQNLCLQAMVEHMENLGGPHSPFVIGIWGAEIYQFLNNGMIVSLTKRKVYSE